MEAFSIPLFYFSKWRENLCFSLLIKESLEFMFYSPGRGTTVQNILICNKRLRCFASSLTQITASFLIFPKIMEDKVDIHMKTLAFLFVQSYHETSMVRQTSRFPMKVGCGPICSPICNVLKPHHCLMFKLGKPSQYFFMFQILNYNRR